MKTLEINLDDFLTAMESSGLLGYLDIQSGEVINLFEDEMEVFSEEDEEYEEYLLLSKKIEENEENRYLEIPHISSHEAFEHMEEFVDTVINAKLREQLVQALSGKKVFRVFKDVINDYPQERQQWFDFKNDKMKQYAKSWLEDIGIELEQESL